MKYPRSTASTVALPLVSTTHRKAATTAMKALHDFRIRHSGGPKQKIIIKPQHAPHHRVIRTLDRGELQRPRHVPMVTGNSCSPRPARRLLRNIPLCESIAELSGARDTAEMTLRLLQR